MTACLAHGIAVDLSDLSAVAKVVPEVVEKFGRLDVVVNNAGQATVTPVLEEDAGRELTMLINVGVPLRLSQAAVEVFRKQEPHPSTGCRGRIVNITSGAAHHGRPNRRRAADLVRAVACASSGSAAGPSSPKTSVGQRVPWHVARDTLLELTTWCTTASAICARLAREVIDLSRTEVGEVIEAVGHHCGTSSTMPQNSNPILSEAIIGLASSSSSLAGAMHRAVEAGPRASGW